MSDTSHADEIKKILLSLAKDGRLTPEDVVKTAKDNPASPLYRHFEWDNQKAADAYRLEQARTLIRSVKITVEVSDVQIRSVRFVRDPSAEKTQAGYIDVLRVRNDKDTSRAVLLDEVKRVNSAANRAVTLAKIFGIQDGINEIRRISDDLVRRMRGDDGDDTIRPAH